MVYLGPVRLLYVMACSVRGVSRAGTVMVTNTYLFYIDSSQPVNPASESFQPRIIPSAQTGGTEQSLRVILEIDLF
jgi:hypothetical protein